MRHGPPRRADDPERRHLHGVVRRREPRPGAAARHDRQHADRHRRAPRRAARAERRPALPAGRRRRVRPAAPPQCRRRGLGRRSAAARAPCRRCANGSIDRGAADAGTDRRDRPRSSRSARESGRAARPASPRNERRAAFRAARQRHAHEDRRPLVRNGAQVRDIAAEARRARHAHKGDAGAGRVYVLDGEGRPQAGPAAPRRHRRQPTRRSSAGDLQDGDAGDRRRRAAQRAPRPEPAGAPRRAGRGCSEAA